MAGASAHMSTGTGAKRQVSAYVWEVRSSPRHDHVPCSCGPHRPDNRLLPGLCKKPISVRPWHALSNRRCLFLRRARTVRMYAHRFLEGSVSPQANIGRPRMLAISCTCVALCAAILLEYICHPKSIWVHLCPLTLRRPSLDISITSSL